jgi:uncharacterized membrane protein YphA (DoxX/SURF4 family)
MTFLRRTRSFSVAATGFGLLAVLALFGVGTASAHEEYVADEEYDVPVSEFLAEALTDPFVVGPLLAGGLAAFAVLGGYLYIRPAPRDVVAFRDAMGEYTGYVPWLLRISFGIPLIGAGFGGYFISPAVEVDLRLLQVGLGFLLLFGLGTRIVALATLMAYLVGVLLRPMLLLQLEFVGGLLAIALIGSGKPSADHVLQRMAGTRGTIYQRVDIVYDYARAFQDRVEPYERYLPTVTRIGLGVTFIYLGLIQKILRPGIALAVVDQYDLTGVVPVSPELWVMGAGLAEIGLGLALIVGLFTRGTAMAAIAMFTLTLFALPDDPVLAHVALFGMASVLLITGSGPFGVDGRLAGTTEATDAGEETRIPTP